MTIYTIYKHPLQWFLIPEGVHRPPLKNSATVPLTCHHQSHITQECAQHYSLWLRSDWVIDLVHSNNRMINWQVSSCTSVNVKLRGISFIHIYDCQNKSCNTLCSTVNLVQTYWSNLYEKNDVNNHKQTCQVKHSINTSTCQHHYTFMRSVFQQFLWLNWFTNSFCLFYSHFLFTCMHQIGSTIPFKKPTDHVRTSLKLKHFRIQSVWRKLAQGSLVWDFTRNVLPRPGFSDIRIGRSLMLC